MGDRFGAFEMVREVKGLGTEEDRMRSTQSIVTCHYLVVFPVSEQQVWASRVCCGSWHFSLCV